MSLPYVIYDKDTKTTRSEWTGDTVDELLKAGGKVFADNGEYGYDASFPLEPYYFSYYGYCEKRERVSTFSENCVAWRHEPFTIRFGTLLDLALFGTFAGNEHS